VIFFFVGFRFVVLLRSREIVVVDSIAVANWVAMMYPLHYVVNACECLYSHTWTSCFFSTGKSMSVFDTLEDLDADTILAKVDKISK
jgi:hypothetical protein